MMLSKDDKTAFYIVLGVANVAALICIYAILTIVSPGNFPPSVILYMTGIITGMILAIFKISD